MLDRKSVRYKKCGIWKVWDMKSARYKNCGIWKMRDIKSVGYEKCEIYDLFPLSKTYCVLQYGEVWMISLIGKEQKRFTYQKCWWGFIELHGFTLSSMHSKSPWWVITYKRSPLTRVTGLDIRSSDPSLVLVIESRNKLWATIKIINSIWYKQRGSNIKQACGGLNGWIVNWDWTGFLLSTQRMKGDLRNVALGTSRTPACQAEVTASNRSPSEGPDDDYEP